MKGKRSSKVLLLGALLLCLILGIAGKSSKMTVCAGEASLVQGEAVQYMGYSTHYYYVNGNLAYCLEPDMASPGNGNYPSEEIDPAQLLGKAMYYVYGGPGYDAYMKPSLNGGWDQPDRAYCLSHCILSYIYDGCNPQSAGFIGLNEDIRNAVIQFTDAIKGWPQIPSTDISLSDTELTAYFSKEEGWQRTSSVTCNGDGTNSLVFSLPEGITLVNESRNVRETIRAAVHGGERFYLAADVTYDNGKTWSSGQVKGTLDQAWRTLVIKTGSGSQDVGAGHLATVEAGTVQMNVRWIPRPEIVVDKKADKGEKKYKVGDIITYSIDVTQQVKDAVAKNVVITDTILTEGVKLQKHSITLLDGNHSVISDAVIAVSGNSYTIHAGEFLQGIESGERYIVEYQVAITDEALIGKEIENEVVVRSDNTEEKKDKEIVVVDKPEEEKPEVPKKEPEIEPKEQPKMTEASIVKTPSVKTGDKENLSVLILLLILSCAAIFICVRISCKTK